MLCFLLWNNRGSALWSLTCAETLLQEADLLAEGVDAVQLLEGVGQQGGFLRQTLVQRQREEAAEWGQRQLQLLHRGRPRTGRGKEGKLDYYSPRKQKSMQPDYTANSSSTFTLSARFNKHRFASHKSCTILKTHLEGLAFQRI